MIYLFSVYNNKDKTTNELRHVNLFSALKDTGKNVSEGSELFNGNLSRSIALVGDSLMEPLVSDLCQIHFQESFFVISTNSTVEMVFMSGSKKTLGSFVKIDARELSAHDRAFNLEGNWYAIV